MWQFCHKRCSRRRFPVGLALRGFFLKQWQDVGRDTRPLTRRQVSSSQIQRKHEFDKRPLAVPLLRGYLAPRLSDRRDSDRPSMMLASSGCNDRVFSLHCLTASGWGLQNGSQRFATPHLSSPPLLCDGAANSLIKQGFYGLRFRPPWRRRDPVSLSCCTLNPLV